MTPPIVLIVNGSVAKRWRLGTTLEQATEDYESSIEYYATRYGSGTHLIAIDQARYEIKTRYTVA